MATTTNYGWETPDDTDLVKDGALAMRTTGNAIDSTLGTAFNNKLHAGLVLIKTQTIGTAVSSVNVTGAFNSSYDNYKIIISGGVASSASSLNFKIGSSTTGYKWGSSYVPYTTGNPSSYSSSNGGTIFSDSGWCGVNYSTMNVELINPYLAKHTNLLSSFAFAGGIATYGGVHEVATSYTDFTVVVAGGGITLTGGTIAVYGYAKD